MSAATTPSTGAAESTARPAVLLYGAVFLVSLAIAWAFYAALPEQRRSQVSNDYRFSYRPAAENLLNGKGLVYSPGRPAVRYPPLHSLFIVPHLAAARITGVSCDTLMLVTAFLLHAVTAILVAWQADRLWGRSAAWVCGLLWGTYLPTIFSSKLIQSEIPFTVLILLTIMVFWLIVTRPVVRPGLLIACGILIGLGLLCRPISIGIPVLLAGLFVWRRRGVAWGRRVGLACLLLAATFVTVLPWEIWSCARTGKFVLLSTGGLPSIVDGLTYDRHYVFGRQPPSPSNDLEEFAVKLYADYFVAKRVTSLRQLTDRLVIEAKQRPMVLVKLYGAKVIRPWYGTDSWWLEWPLFFIQLPYVLLGFVGCWKCWRWGTPRQRDMAILVATLILYNWFMTVVALSIVRYMVPVMWLLILMIPAVVLCRGPAVAKPAAPRSRLSHLDGSP